MRGEGERERAARAINKNLGINRSHRRLDGRTRSEKFGKFKIERKKRRRRGRRSESVRSLQLEHPRIKFARRSRRAKRKDLLLSSRASERRVGFRDHPVQETTAGRAIRSNFPRRVRGTRRGVATNLRSPPDLEARRQQTNYGKTIRPRSCARAN